MSRLLVTQYQAEVEKIIQYGGSRKETSIRVAFQNLLNEYCKPRDFLLIPELDYKLPNGKLVYPDGTIKDALRLDWGYWESKDQYDKLDEEIEKKLNKGYPDSNILFEDSQTAVLIQSGQENQRVSMRDADAVDRIINNFINYVRPEVRDFREAIDRFIRWASDRLGKNGIIAFITNSSFIDGRAFDGFRKAVTDDFSYIYIIDLHGDVRKNPKLSGTTHNVFGIQTGVAIMFLVKKLNSDFNNCQIFHIRRPDFDTASEKLKFLSQTKFNQIAFDHITPDKNYNWINQADTNFDTLISLVDKNVKDAKNELEEKVIFKFYTNGIKSNRDEWVYDFDKDTLSQKVNFFIDFYNSEIKRYKQAGKVENLDNFVDYTIKWSESLKKKLLSYKDACFDEKLIKFSLYRPFTQQYFYYDFILNDRLTTNHSTLFGKRFEESNVIIYFSGTPLSKPFQVFVSQKPCDYHFLEQTQCLPLYRYDKEGKRIDNITDWGLKQIQTHYQDPTITKIDIFHYTYAVLHNPAYRSKYELNLKREFPRLPYYENFDKWVNWGKQLMELHINYETVTPYQLTRVDIPLKDNQKTPKPKLKADKTSCCIILDDVTTLSGIPNIAWEYMLGNRCALEWILDQYKEKKPKDPTIAEKFNTYRFADYKEQVIELLMRVCTVSVETMNIIKEME
jgi:predicted helicase